MKQSGGMPTGSNAGSRPSAARAARQRKPLRIGAVPAIIMHPRCWPRWVRRLFLLTFPVSIVGWLGLAILVAVLTILRGLWLPVVKFWNAPRRYRYRYGDHSYPNYVRRWHRSLDAGGRQRNPAEDEGGLAPAE